MRKLFILLFTVTSIGSASAQSFINLEEDRIFYAGLNLGCNISQVDGDGFSGYHKVGFRGGVQVFARLAPNFATSLGLIFAQKGSVEKTFIESTIGPALFEYRMHLQYVEMPLQFHYFQGPKWTFGGGVAYGRLINAKEEAYSVNPIKIDPDLYPFKRDEWSWMLSLGYRFYKHWIIQGHYQYTIGNIREGDQLPPQLSIGPERNNVICLQALILLGTGMNSK